VNGTNIYSTHVTAISSDFKTITVDVVLPSSFSTGNISLSRMDAYAIGNTAIPSGVLQGIIFFNTGSGQWRLGAWPNSDQGSYSTSSNVAWFASKYTGLNYNRLGEISGQQSFPTEPYRQASFTITISQSLNTSTLRFGNSTLVLPGTTNPWPISIVAELMDSSQVNNVVIASGSTESLVIQGSGFINAINTWTTSSLTQSSTAAGGTNYITSKFENNPLEPLSAVLVDKQGYFVPRSPQTVATFFLGAGQMKQFVIDFINYTYS
jgi:hypothetical protein